ncbi:MAG: adenosylhomocysteine nucleosidase [Verrucomicrobiota bacterium]|jgi:adenosylhomocysteine nucleosidase
MAASPRMIALTFALPAESRDIVRSIRGKRIDQCGDAKIIYGKLDGNEVAISHTGVGRAACQQQIDHFLDAVRPEFLVSSGFAGGTGDDLKAGDLIVAENFSDARLLAEAVKGAANLRRVKLHTAASIIDTAEERRRIAQESGAEAIDMETDVIARACAARGVRMLSLRVISDTPGQSFPIPPRILFNMERQSTEMRQLLIYLVKHPSAIWRLVRFARRIAEARNQMTAAIIAVVKTM